MRDEGWLTLAGVGAILVGNLCAAGFGGWRLGLKVVGLGLLAPWLIWITLVVACWMDAGGGAGSCDFVVRAGFGMVGVAGSLYWLFAAVPGMAIGSFGHWALRNLSWGTRERSD